MLPKNLKYCKKLEILPKNLKYCKKKSQEVRITRTKNGLDEALVCWRAQEVTQAIKAKWQLTKLHSSQEYQNDEAANVNELFNYNTFFYIFIANTLLNE